MILVLTIVMGLATFASLCVGFYCGWKAGVEQRGGFPPASTAPYDQEADRR